MSAFGRNVPKSVEGGGGRCECLATQDEPYLFGYIYIRYMCLCVGLGLALTLNP